MLKELIKLANHLDQKGLRSEADFLDSLVRSASESSQVPIYGPAIDTFRKVTKKTIEVSFERARKGGASGTETVIEGAKIELISPITSQKTILWEKKDPIYIEGVTQAIAKYKEEYKNSDWKVNTSATDDMTQQALTKINNSAQVA